MIPAIAGALVAGGMSAASSVGNGAMQAATNKRARQHEEYMYWLQRNNSLQDWNMQNEYNSPQAQMKRLKEAGLNPNLVYGKGADNVAGSISQPSTSTPSFRAPQYDFGGAVSSGMSAYVDLRMKEAQIDNLKTANTVAIQDAALKAAQTASTNIGTSRNQFELGQAQTLAQTSVDTAKESLRKLTADTDATIHDDERRTIMQSSNLREAAERILQSRSQRATNATQRAQIQQQIRNLKNDETLKQLDIELQKKGIQKSDPAYMRILTRLLGDNSDALPQSGSQFSDRWGRGVNKIFDWFKK